MSTETRLRRLREELDETDPDLDLTGAVGDLVVTEVDQALRPRVHERRAATSGVIVEPSTDSSAWETETQLNVARRTVDELTPADARLFTDGRSSWLVRRIDGPEEWLVFDRPAGSERDLVVLAEAFGAVIVQRHPTGTVRVVGAFGVLRWDGFGWHHEPPVSSWIDSLSACGVHGDRDVVETMLEFAVHDLGSQGIGAILVYRPDDGRAPGIQARLSTPPPLEITRPTDLAPLRHALAQIDGATMFDPGGRLLEIGVRLVPTPTAESSVAGYRGMRHTAGRRYSYDDPHATVIVVSEDGPVTVLRNGKILGASPVRATDETGEILD